ncbi:hypothetical protein [Rubripirellula tenax]|uniref:hypothetical protein n=1 Tax=Rubripirellula tenax TaxID=2528015 RepID=UPI0011B54C48|nr:hypothetical protein [Rubripirellula tenax]
MFELHVSGENISESSVNAMETRGVERNSFVRHVNVVESKWRGTIHTKNHDAELWEWLNGTLAQDSRFRGVMEEECVLPTMLSA